VNRERGSVSVVVAAIVLIALVMSVGLADMARVLVARSHARTAADAAALAVAQELVLPSGTDPAQVAVQYAERNGAVVTGCACTAGTFEDTVTVAITVEGFLLITGVRTVTARARAVVDVPATPAPSPAGPA
jgi:secretion/DNA translocation related TadE-like protein